MSSLLKAVVVASARGFRYLSAIATDLSASAIALRDLVVIKSQVTMATARKRSRTVDPGRCRIPLMQYLNGARRFLSTDIVVYFFWPETASSQSDQISCSRVQLRGTPINS